MNRSGVSKDVCTSVCCFCMDVFMCPFHWETKASYSAMTGVRVEIVLTTGSLDVFTQLQILQNSILRKFGDFTSKSGLCPAS